MSPLESPEWMWTLVSPLESPEWMWTLVRPGPCYTNLFEGVIRLPIETNMPYIIDYSHKYFHYH